MSELEQVNPVTQNNAKPTATSNGAVVPTVNLTPAKIQQPAYVPGPVNLFALRTNEAKLLTSILKDLKKIMSGFDIRFYDDKLEFSRMENSSSVFIAMEIQKSFFDTWCIENLQDKYYLPLGKNSNIISILEQVVKSATQVFFSLDYGKKLTIHNKAEHHNVNYLIPLQVSDSDNNELVEKASMIPLECNITLDAFQLENILTFMKTLPKSNNTQLQIRAVAGKLTLTAKDDKTGTEQSTDIEIMENHFYNDKYESWYDYDYLNNIFSLFSNKQKMKTLGSVKLEFASEHPMRLTFNYTDGIKVIYLMAPLETETD